MKPIEAIDQGALFFFTARAERVPVLDEAVIRLTTLGNTEVLVLVPLLSFLHLLALGHRRAGLVVVVAALFAWGVSESSKWVVNRPRPDVPPQQLVLALPGNASFPSGHALVSLAVYGTIGLVLARRARHPAVQSAALAVGFMLPLGIAFSRIYLGVHYVSDVVGGLCAGGAVVLVADWLDRHGTSALAQPGDVPQHVAHRDHA